MIRTAIIAVILLAFAAGAATYVHYQSFDPCVWMEKDIANRSGLPRLAAKARIQSQFLIRGIADPNAGECVMAWWEYRADNATGGS